MDEEKNSQFNSTFKQATSKLTKKEKLTFFGFLFLAVLIIYLGFQQMGNNLKTPFALFALKYSGGEETIKKTESQLMEELKNKDTDKDGLSDYDELFVYNTSPYLPDSDSDGIGDKEEIEASTDPNCPQGQNCYFNEIVNATASGENNTKILDFFSSDSLSLEENLLQGIITGSPDPKVIREILLQNGVDPKDLNEINDQDLLLLFNEIMNTDFSVDNKEEQILDLDADNLNVLRQLLKESGIPEETLKQLDDAALLDLIKQTQYE